MPILLLASNALAANVASPQSNAAPANALTLSVDDFSQTVPNETLDSWISKKTTLGMSSGYRSEFENVFYCPVSKVLCALTVSSANSRSMHLTSESNIDQQAIEAYVEDLSRKVNRDPVDAKFSIDNGKASTFEPAKIGITLDVQKSVAVIEQALEKFPLQSPQNLSLPFDSKKAEIDYADVNDIGISSLIGEGTSNFKGSPVNRIKNLKVASQRFNGVLIKPGEEFSFVKILGDVDADHGYFPELVIKQGVTEPEFGGGICQVSTTAFRAAIYSGLKITARRNHAYPVSYYNPQGMDSTVYVPQPDLKFINNTPGYILIQTKIAGTILTFDFYGTDDGRKTTVDGPYITDKQPDGAMKAHFTQHVVDKNGNEFINAVFNSSYASPYKYPHPGGPTLSAKPSNWSDDEWKAYKQTLKDMAKAQQNKA